MSTKGLKNGFYWVKYLGEEQIAEYYNGSFLITGNENCQEPEIMDEINERVERGQHLTTSDVKALLIQHVSQLCELFIPEPKFDINVNQDPKDDAKLIVNIKRG